MFTYLNFLYILLLAFVVAEFELLFLVLPIFLAGGGAPYVPTLKRDIKKIISISNAKPRDKVADIGSGDGRILVAFARKGIEAHGYEVSPALVAWSKLKIFTLGLSNKAFVHQSSFWEKDFSEFNVVVVFGMTKIMGELDKKLNAELKPGSVVVSNIFKLPGREASASDGNIRRYDII